MTQPHNRKNIKDQRFGRLIAVEQIGRKSGFLFWRCLCDCGNEKVINGNSLRLGRTKSCGCLRNEKVSKVTIKNLTGQQFGRLTVIKEAGRTKNKQVIWKCKCECGNIKTIRASLLMRGESKSCGCLRSEKASKQCRKNIYGQKFSRWTVIKEMGKDKWNQNTWLCRCKCGNENTLSAHSLLSGNSKSCGCLKREIAAKTIKAMDTTGVNNGNWRGGISFEPYCFNWNKELKDFIKERDGYKCLNPLCNKQHSVLSVHHVDYDKKSCDAQNLITLCKSCNTIANANRGWHESWYNAILYQRYGIKEIQV